MFRETANYHRCGRTDKGVSAYGQVGLYDSSYQRMHINCGWLYVIMNRQDGSVGGVSDHKVDKGVG